LLLFIFSRSPRTSAAQESIVDQSVQIWKDDLSGTDPGTIQDAAYQIGTHSNEFVDDRQVISKLTALLADQRLPVEVREVAAYALGSIGSTASDAAPQLVRSLGDSNPDVRRAAVEALGKIGPAGNPPLDVVQSLMRQGPIEIRVSALEALARLFPPRDAIPLLEQNAKNSNIDLRLASVEALAGLLSQKDAVMLLTSQLRGGDVRLQKAVAYSLAQFGPDAIDAAPQLEALLRSPDADVRQVSAWTIGLMGPSAAPYAPSLAKLLGDDPNPTVQINAATALGSIGSDDQFVVNALARQLTYNGNFEVKTSCAQALGGIGNGPLATAALFQAIRANADPALQLAAASELGRMDPQPNSNITDLLRISDASDYHLREAAIRAIGHIHQQGKVAIPQLTAAMLRDSQPSVRVAAAQALGEYDEFLAADQASAARVLYALTEACSNGKTRFAASQSIARVAKELRRHFQGSPSRQDQVLVKPLQIAANELNRQSEIGSGRTDENANAAVEDAQSALNRNLHFDEYRRWLSAHPLVFYVGSSIFVYLLWLTFVSVIVMRFFPLTLLEWGNTLADLKIKVPDALGGLQLSIRSFLLLNLYRHPKVLNAWVERYADIARYNYKNLDVYRLRKTYVPLPMIFDGEMTPVLSVDNLRLKLSRQRWCLRIVGEGGAGKTSLACQIASWGLGADPAKRVCPDRRMIPIIVERGSDTSVFTDVKLFSKTIRGQLQNIVNETQPLPVWLCEALLRDRRVLVVIDGLSELDNAPSALPLHPDFPVAALIVTSRSNRIWSDAVHVDIEPLRIDSNHLLPFMNAYLASETEVLDDAELYEACRHLARLVGKDRSITPLLARLYVEQLSKGILRGAGARDVPADVPALVLGYLNTINRERRPTDPDQAVIREAATVAAWECCKDELRVGYARKSEVYKAFADGDIKSDVLDYLESKLQLIRSIPPAETHIEFSLDPLAEYLASLRLVSMMKGEADWNCFLEKVDEMSVHGGEIGDLLKAVWDCCKHADSRAQVPDQIVEAIYSRAFRSESSIAS
jgi:HEAT repeat protein